MSLRTRLLAAGAAALIALGGCGDDEDNGADDTGAPQTTAAPTEGPAPDAASPSKPKVEVPKGDPPAGLQIEDLKEGTGPTARAGDSVTVHYVGVSYSTGEQFDASWDAGQPFPFTLGTGSVIQGWDEGVAGMKVGGRRRLTIPPELGYGETGQPPDIAPNETLVFVVDLIDIG